MRTADVIRAWKGIALGRRPLVSIEVTRECPLRCPGCYAYEDNHLGGLITLRELNDSKGDSLVAGILGVVDELKPLHVSLVGGDPLVRYREMEQVIPQIIDRGIHVQLVTSAFRPMHASWRDLPHLTVVVSIDGLQPDHDVRRTPATYDRILKNIDNQRITIHCTVTSAMFKRDGYLDEFLAFWTPRPQIEKVWLSLFTPQRGATDAEILTAEQRKFVIKQIGELGQRYPKLAMPGIVLRGYENPPASPDDCIFARTTETISADLRTRVTPCQFGGDPDCSQCGCVASAGLAAVGNYKLGGVLPLSTIFKASQALGNTISRAGASRTLRPAASPDMG